MHALNTAPPRLIALDTMRGCAMLWMTGFHFCFDLHYFGLLQTNFYTNPVWTVQRQMIVSLFLFCAGAGQAMAVEQQQSWGRFWHRWRRVAGAAVLVSVASYLVFPASYIYFGILHGMAVMLVLARLAAIWNRSGRWSLALCLLGALALFLPDLAAPLHAHWSMADVLNGRSLNWLGLISHKPVTEDYAPLFPWLGVVLWGVVAAGVLRRRHSDSGPKIVQKNPATLTRMLAWLGRNSLPYYLLHQPFMLAALGLFTQLSRA